MARDALLKRAAARRKRKGKVRAPVYPSGVERSHLAVLRAIHAEVMMDVKEAARRAFEGMHRDAFEDDYDMAVLRANAATALIRRLSSIRRSAERLAEANRLALIQAMGMPLVFKDEGLGALMDTFVGRHVQLITRMESEVISDIGVLVRQGVDSGLSWRELQGDIADRAGVGKFRAELIARTEISSSNMELNKSRFKELGVERCRWRTALDERVREAHRRMEGVEFALDEPPHVGGGTDDKGRKIPDEGNHLPGQYFQCRCRCEPIVDWLEE